MEKEKFLLKDQLFNREKIEKIAEDLQKNFSSFKKQEFIKTVLSEFSKLELKQRIVWIAEMLKKYLPQDYLKALQILLKSLPLPNNESLEDGDYGDFIYATFAEFVAKNGCNKKYLKSSFNALYEITKRFSVEDAIRYFLNAFPEETLQKLLLWSKDKNYHVRRLCSEGARPKLPWSQKINIPINSTLPILENLFSDKTRFVVRSVANHLNDISKTDPDLVLQILKKWKNSQKQNPKEMEYLTHHALRTLVKQGDKKALEFIGFGHSVDLKILNFKISEKVRINNFLEFSFKIFSEQNQEILIDYIIFFQNKNGKMESKKVFKLKKIPLKKGEKVEVFKKHFFREDMTTRKLYKGEHSLQIQINGNVFIERKFFLI